MSIKLKCACGKHLSNSECFTIHKVPVVLCLVTSKRCCDGGIDYLRWFTDFMSVFQTCTTEVALRHPMALHLILYPDGQLPADPRGAVAQWLEHSTDWPSISCGFESHWGRLETLAVFFTPLCQCLSDDTLKSVGPFYLVSMPGEVKAPTQWCKWVTCRGLHILPSQ